MDFLIYKKVKNYKFSDKQIKKIIELTLKSVFKKIDFYEISIHIIGEQSIKKINYRYRGINKITDVISFAIQDVSFGQNAGNDLGDLFICPKKIVKQAKEFSVDYKKEFTRILIHGVLHLCGFDHINESDKEKMFQLQERILQKLI